LGGATVEAMNPLHGQFGAFFLIALGHFPGFHFEAPFEDDAIAEFEFVVDLLGTIAPADNFESFRGVVGA
jgi:hypothetical protein